MVPSQRDLGDVTRLLMIGIDVDVVQDLEEPGASVRALFELVPNTERAQERLLHQVLGVPVVPREAARVLNNAGMCTSASRSKLSGSAAIALLKGRTYRPSHLVPEHGSRS